MDPNANLAEQLEIARYFADPRVAYAKPDEILDKACRLAELVLALDAWIVGDGFMPARWVRTRTRSPRMLRSVQPQCPACGSLLTARTTKDGAPSYCDTCDKEI